MKKKPNKSPKVKHYGDCSIYKKDSDICDCGAFRDMVMLPKEEITKEMWSNWFKHLAAIDRSTEKSIPNWISKEAEWDPVDPLCVRCGGMMYLKEGHLWPEEIELCVCDDCAHELLEQFFMAQK